MNRIDSSSLCKNVFSISWQTASLSVQEQYRKTTRISNEVYLNSRLAGFAGRMSRAQSQHIPESIISLRSRREEASLVPVSNQSDSSPAAVCVSRPRNELLRAMTSGRVSSPSLRDQFVEVEERHGRTKGAGREKREKEVDEGGGRVKYSDWKIPYIIIRCEGRPVRYATRVWVRVWTKCVPAGHTCLLHPTTGARARRS